jgi:hypothetical protein
MGLATTASGYGSVAMGLSTTASAEYSVAMGVSTISSNWASIAMGLATTASNWGSVAMGISTTASGYGSVAMGESLTAEAKSSVAFGRYNVGGGNGNSWVATDPLFELGIGTGAAALANAVTVLKNGKVGIGTATPSEKLEVNGNILQLDNDKHLFGTTNTDLQIYSDGTDGVISTTNQLKVYGDMNVSGYVDGKGYVTQYHRNATIDTTSANTWVNITWDLTIDEETTSGHSLSDSNTSITIESDGIYRVQGCLHPKNNGVGNQEANLYSRVLINGVEAKCLQFANSKEFKTTGIDTMPFTGTLYAEAGQKVQLQYYVTSTNIDFEGDAVFDDAVAGSINFEKLSK